MTPFRPFSLFRARTLANGLSGLVLSFLAGASLMAEELSLPWRWSNPLPNGNNVYDLSVKDAWYVQVTDHGQIYVSTNRLEWSPRVSGVTNSLRAVMFHQERIIITGENGTILHGGLAAPFERATLTPPTTDWLESVAGSDSLLVAVGDEAAIYTSPDAVQWQRVSGLPFSDWLRGVAYGGGTFVAVGENGLIATSTDGTQWRRRSSGTTRHLNRAAFRGGIFYAVGEGGISLFSFNQGANWTGEATGTTNNLFAVGLGDPARLVTGEAALQLKETVFSGWSDQLGADSPLPAPTWVYNAALWDGARFLVAGRTGLLVESFQTNTLTGTLWLPADESPRNWLWEVARVADQYIAVGDHATVMTSLNGVDWSTETVPSSLANSVFLGVGGSPALMVAVGDAGSLMLSRGAFTEVVTTNVVVSFVDCLPVTNTVPVTNLVNLLGLVWEAISPSPTTNTLQGVCERDGLTLVVGDAGTVLRTRGGTNWLVGTVAGKPNLSSVAAGPDNFVAVGAGGAMAVSADGVTWVPRNTGTSNWLYRARYLGGRFVCVGQNGTLMTSPDGDVWTSRASGTTAWLTDAILVGDRYFVSGTQGTVLTSTDTVDWTPVAIITGKSLYGLAAAGRQLVAVGVEGVILRTSTEPLAPVNFIRFAHEECSAASLDRFIFHGQVDQRFRLEFTDDLKFWHPLQEFEPEQPVFPFQVSVTNRPAGGRRYFRTSVVAP